MLRLERGVWPTGKRLRQATNEYAPPQKKKKKFLGWGIELLKHEGWKKERSGAPLP